MVLVAVIEWLLRQQWFLSQLLNGYVDNNDSDTKLSRMLCAVFLSRLDSAAVMPGPGFGWGERGSCPGR
jgi:hypothetical protein